MASQDFTIIPHKSQIKYNRSFPDVVRAVAAFASILLTGWLVLVCLACVAIGLYMAWTCPVGIVELVRLGCP